MEMEENPPRLHKISISGATLSALLHLTSSTAADSLGLLFGDTSFLSPPSLSDSPSTSPSTPLLSATVTSFLSSSLPHLLPPATSTSTLLGVFSSRRRSLPVPSLRDASLILSLPSDHRHPRVLFLLTTPPPPSASLIHTHEYRAFQYIPIAGRFEPVSVEIMNVGGLGFRGGYESFRPVAEGEGEGALGLEGLGRLVGEEAERYKKGVEGVYEKMLMTVERLSREVEKSNATVYEMVATFSL